MEAPSPPPPAGPPSPPRGPRRRARRALRVLALVLLGLAVWLALGLRPPRAAVPPQGVRLEGVVVVEPGKAERPGFTVEAQGGTLVRVEPTEGAPAGPWAGRYVLPGLVDLHVHHPPSLAVGERALFALLFLAHGVTTVRDVGSIGGGMRAHRRAIAEGRLAGPRTFTCGPFLDGDPPSWPGAIAVTDAPSARAAVERLAREGFDCVKLYNRVPVVAVRAAKAAAREHRLPVVAHLPWGVPLREMGGVELQHLMGLTEIAGGGRRGVEPYVSLSRRLGIRHTPTLVVFARAAGLAAYEAMRRDPAAALLPAHYRDILWNPERNPRIFDLVPDGFHATGSRVRLMKQTVKRLHESGVPVTAGTDTLNPFVVPGAALHEELHHLVAAGLTPAEALAAAGRDAGRALGRPMLGAVAPGAPADLLVLREDPTRDLAALETWEAVVADGRLYTRAQLEAEVARQQRHFEGAVPRLVLGGLARVAAAYMRRLEP